jgi:hypothetical protein
MEPSIYTQCSNAARRLASEPEVFTEDDVVREAAQDDWTEKNFAEAERHAPQVLAALYRGSRLVRFGVVDADTAPLTGEADYVRRSGDRGSQIVYGSFGAWEGRLLNTPNGDFPAITYSHDPIYKVGRRKASQRDDFKPWDGQKPAPRERVDAAALKRELATLRTALSTVRAERDDLRAEVAQLRSQVAA